MSIMNFLSNHQSGRFRSKQKGTGMVEILIAAGIMAIVMVAVINVYHSLAALSLQNTEKIQSTFLLEEGVEAIHVMRDNSWTTNIAALSTNPTYYFRFQGGTWVATTTPQIIDEFTRTFRLADVSRDGSFNIVTLGGSNDANSRKVTVTVSWYARAGTTTASVDTYIFNTFNN
jgi:Tfp pilus assembly protein PilV